MKRIVPVLVVAALAVAGFYWRAPLMAALGFGDEDRAPLHGALNACSIRSA